MTLFCLLWEDMARIFFLPFIYSILSFHVSVNVKTRIQYTKIVILFYCFIFILNIVSVKEEHNLRIFESKVLKEVFSSQRDEVIEYCVIGFHDSYDGESEREVHLSWKILRKHLGNLSVAHESVNLNELAQDRFQ